VDPADHYLDLVKLGKDAFVSSVAPAALIRSRPDPSAVTPMPDVDASRESNVDLDTETWIGDADGPGRRRSRKLEIFPLAKKPNAPFPDMITVGRTPNNDIVLRDATVSRLHAFFKYKTTQAPDGSRTYVWQIADGGSKNGTSLDGLALAPRKERGVSSGQVVKIGDLELTFYASEDLFKLLTLVT
jgi:hypothetical protein